MYQFWKIFHLNAYKTHGNLVVGMIKIISKNKISTLILLQVNPVFKENIGPINCKLNLKNPNSMV